MPSPEPECEPVQIEPVRDVESWFEIRGYGDALTGAMEALRAIGLPPEQWVVELNDMEEDGSISGFIQAVRQERNNAETERQSQQLPEGIPKA